MRLFRAIPGRSLPTRVTTPTRGGVATAAVAHAVALTAIGHCHYLIQPPSRLVWMIAELVVAAVVWRLGRGPVGRLTAAVAAVDGSRLSLAVGVGLAVWWHGRPADTVWIHAPELRPALDGLLFAAHAVLATAVFAIVLVGVAASDPPPGEPTPERTTRGSIAGIVLFATAAVAFAAWFVAHERVIYFADAMYYWTEAANWAAEAVRSPAAGWWAFRISVQNGGYTLLPATVPGATMTALGDHRLVYVGTVAAVYLTGTAAAAAWFVRRTGPADARFSTAVPAVLLFTMPLAWIPVLRGYPDVGGVALAIVSLWLVAGRPRAAVRWPHLFGTAAVLAAMILFRRWYTFWAVGLLAVSVVDGLTGAAVHLYRRRLAAARAAIRPAAVLCALVPLTLVAVAWPMVRDRFTVDYADAFAAYRSAGSLPSRVWATCREIGLGYFLLSGLSVIPLLQSKETRRPTGFLIGITAVMVPLFYRIQDPDRHHKYLVLPALLLPPAMAATHYLTRIPRWCGWGAVGTLAAAGSVGLLGTVDPDWQAAREHFVPLAPSSSYPPVAREDLDEFVRLLRFLNGETARTGEHFAVLSSSPDLHASMFAAAERSLRVPFPAASYHIPTADVDRVNGFPAGLFKAGLVIVADPPQIHLRPEEQRVVLIPQRLLREGSGFGRAFNVLPDRFTFQNGITVSLYRRVLPIAPGDMTAFCEELRQAHPQRPFVYRPAEPIDQLMQTPR